MSTSELACTDATLILHDEGIAITSEKISGLVKTANVSVESYCASLFAKLAEKRNVDDLIMNVTGGATAAPIAAATAAPAADEKEETKEESDDEMCISLFD